MKKLVVLVIILILNTGICFAQKRNSEGYVTWRTPNTCPRKVGGIKDIEEHRQWIQSFAGQNDLCRAGLPEKIRKLAIKLTQNEYYGYNRKIIFPTGEEGTISNIIAPEGTRYRNLTFGDGQVLPNVILGFDSYIYRIEIKDNFGIIWIIDTHKICANQGDYRVNIITPKPPSTLTPVVEEAIRYYYEEEKIHLPKFNYASEKSVQFTGIWNGLSQILAAVWRRPDNISMSAYGGTFTGGSWTQSNFNNQNQSQGQGQGQSNYNSNVNSPTFNNTNSSTNNNINQNQNNQNINDTINVGP